VKTFALLALAAMLAVGCAHGPRAARDISDAEYDALTAKPTPASWSPGARWTFIELDNNGAVVRTMTVRVTHVPGDHSFTDGDWRRLEVVAVSPMDAMPSGYQTIGSTKWEHYSVSKATGAFLVVELENQNHWSHAYVGEVSEQGFVGQVRAMSYSYGPGRPGQWSDSEVQGAVYGVPVAE
jgi:hypothetical protein